MYIIQFDFWSNFRSKYLILEQLRMHIELHLQWSHFYSFFFTPWPYKDKHIEIVKRHNSRSKFLAVNSLWNKVIFLLVKTNMLIYYTSKYGHDIWNPLLLSSLQAMWLLHPTLNSTETMMPRLDNNIWQTI